MAPRKRKTNDSVDPVPESKPKPKPKRAAPKGKVMTAKEARECKEAFFAGTKGSKRLQESMKASASAAKKQLKKDPGLGWQRTWV